jgi:hypothetical protein
VTTGDHPAAAPHWTRVNIGARLPVRPSALAIGIALLLLPAALTGQAIFGVVVEDGTAAPIASVTVELLARDSTIQASTTTAASGHFSLPVRAGGRFYLRASHPSYTQSGGLAVAVKKQELVTVILRMGRTAIPLEPLLVTARSHDRASGFRERASGRGMGRYITRAEIDKRVANRPSDLLRTTPEVRIETVRDGSGVFTSNAILMHSLGEPCAPAIYLDGIPISMDFGVDVDDLITSELLEGIEIYQSYVSAPLELHIPRDTCGVVAFWSRSARGSPLTLKRLGIGALLAGMMLLVMR